MIDEIRRLERENAELVALLVAWLDYAAHLPGDPVLTGLRQQSRDWVS